MKILWKQSYHFQKPSENIKDKSNVSNVNGQMSPSVEGARPVLDVTDAIQERDQG